MKVKQEIITFVLEDCVEVGLQFFYFEKYSFMPDYTVIFNAVFMIVKALELTVRMIIWMKDDYRDTKESDRRKNLLFVFVFFLNGYPISRAAGAIYQSTRGDAIVRVSYI